MKITLINGAASGYGQGIEKITEIVSNTFKELEVKITEINLSLIKLPYYDGTSYTSVEKVIDELRTSDGIIFACSALKFSPSAVMQTFIEHLDPYLYGEFLTGKNCFTIVSSYDGSEYFADEYLNRVLRSVGAYGAVRLSAGREYAQKIAYDSSVIDIIEKHAEDFYRVLKRNSTFIISQTEITQTNTQNEYTPKIVPEKSTPKIQETSSKSSGFTPVPDNYRPEPKTSKSDYEENYRPQYSKNEYYEFNDSRDYVPKYADNYENPQKHKKQSNPYEEQQRFSKRQNSYEEPDHYHYNRNNYDEPERYSHNSYNEPDRYNGSTYNNDSQNINYLGFDKQQEADINELTRLLADEYNKSENNPDRNNYSERTPDYSRAKNVSNLYKNNFTMSEQVIPHVKSCKQKTQSLYHHFNSQLAKGLDALIQLHITGNENFSACLTIGDGECTYTDGVHPSPSVTIFADSVIWNNILDGKLTSQKAFMVGQIKVKGNFALLSKFDQLFKF